MGVWKSFRMTKNAFYFTLKAIFILKIFEFLPWLFDSVEKRRDWKDKVNFKIYEVATWLKNSYTTHIAQYLKK